MKEIKIKLYPYQELSKEAQKEAYSTWKETADDPFMQAHLGNLLKEELEARGITYDTDSVNVFYSLTHNQGDGLMFEGKLIWNGIDVTIKPSGRYYHSHSKTVDMPEASEREYTQFENVYQDICDKLERLGYEHLDYITSEEAFIQECEDNEYLFEENGILRP